MLIRSKQIPTTPFLDSLGHLLGDESARIQLADSLRDPRLDAEQWRTILHRELLQLYHWSVRRILHASQTSDEGTASPRRVISLLPRTAIAAHLLRRAVPFAALGIPTVCGFPPPLKVEGQHSTVVLAQTLDIATLLQVDDRQGASLVAAMDPADLVIVTGQRTTVAQIRSVAPGRVVGSTGRCAILLGTDPVSLRKVYSSLRQLQVPQSCSRLRATFLCESLDSPTITCSSFPDGVTSYRVGEVLRRLHPSVIFVPRSTNPYPEDLPAHLGGYCIICCSDDGRATQSIGFGADPIYDWPGDYLI